MYSPKDLDPLFQPLQLNGLTLPNRLAMAPMTRGFCPGNVPTDQVAAYYRRRAEGGTALLISEGVGIDHPAAVGIGAGSAEHVPVMYGDEAIAGWKKVVDEVHQGGGFIFPQLWHQGGFRLPGTGPVPSAETISPSGSWGPTDRRTNAHAEYMEAYAKPHKAMTEEDVSDVVSAFARSAVIAQEIGFDGIAIHGASGYLIDSFLWPETNRRTDRYGGDMTGRSRFAAEIVQAIRNAVGPDMPILFRFGQWKQQDFDARIAETPDELGVMLTALADAGVDMFDASTLYFNKPAFEGSPLPLAAWTKQLSGKPSMAVGGIGLSESLFNSLSIGGATVEKNYFEAAERMARGEFDSLALGRALISDPDWANKVRAGEEPAVFRREDLAQLI
ncbi:NADH:flavin oxidoreductase [Pseudomaricurvus sp. HS19]|uniref:NADH:flavin oxidoreductase n=1 Tax=Pseudomaricurvus sp. HS19 TaxID=2692626 RepID=UPI00136ABF20|nr:NADH:flavin oxidoreductase [Pseudomaricurvus sp. HS19]MYM61924.1 12-oxophytodienoate reductase [Pseudomaricurvus sp. HS19]